MIRWMLTEFQRLMMAMEHSIPELEDQPYFEAQLSLKKPRGLWMFQVRISQVLIQALL